MVMKRNMMGRNLRRSIARSMGRYIAIALIIALGTAIFVGLRSTKMDMVATGQAYTEAQNMYDLRFLSTYGWEKEEVERAAQLEGVQDAEGVFYADLIARSEKKEDDLVYRFYTIPEAINRLVLLEGRMPEQPDECLADGFRNDGKILGSRVFISEENAQDGLEELKERAFTVVGLVSTPLYMDTNRGNTSVGSGSIANFYFVPEEAFDIEYYKELHVTIPGDHQIYSQEYNDALEAAADLLKPELEAIAGERVDSIRADARAEYEDGLADYNQAEADYQKEKAEAITKLEDAKKELEQSQQKLDEGEQELEAGRQQLAEGREQLQQQLALYGSIPQLQAMEQQLNDQEAQLNQAQEELEENKKKLTEGFDEWEQSQKDAQEEFRNAEAELAEAKQELQDAWQKICDIEDAEIYALDRNTNVGYCSLDSNSDIVAGVSRVFPAFFLLVAALVCITTMTRMVEEERTQIGTLKALGYSKMAIVSKYLLYAGSSAVLGCVLGVILGSILFPVVLWQAYKIILVVTPNILIRFDWQMALSVTALYTLAMLAVSWYCCHRALQEVPAELIRPKAPGAGKKLLLERIPLWERVSFLNKVAIRNIFRYRQRLVMMLLGIGGCTALLMTGFGIRDSIERIVEVQFREVTQYDLEVHFRSAQTEQQQEAFRAAMEKDAQDILFFNQVSGSIQASAGSRDIYILTATEQMADYLDFHRNGAPITPPGTNEVLLTTGMADILDIEVGDQVVLRDPDMRELSVTVSGIYENHVYNYALVTPETVMEQWDEEPEKQTAYVILQEGRNPDNAGAAASGLDTVANVMVCQQTADTVKGMMSALDLVVVVVVLCAGMLAVVVLYNLTNININERIREIATIKVLGFNARETGMYVFKENLVLSLLGVLVGIPLGKLLLQFVISQIKIELIWLKPLLTTPSLLASVLLTILAAIVVNCLFYSTLDRINMAEALKSVE